MVVIKKRNNIIPVEFGDFTLEFVSNDLSIRKMEEVGKKLQKEGGELAEKADNNALDALQGMVKESWTALFGVEAYDKVYAFSGESTVDAMAYLLETIAGVVNEWEQRNNVDALKKYLGD